jgi:hypothetical protein
MKILLKLTVVAFTAAVLFFTTNVKAQTTPAHALLFGIGVDAGLPTGNLTIGSNFVLGGTARLQYGISNNFAVTLTSGADHFFSKINPATGKVFDSFGIIPIKAGVKEFFVPSIYFGVEAGIGLEETDSGEGNTKFLVSPAIGWANNRWDIGFRYDNYSGNDKHSGQSDPYGFVALRIGYGFKL